MYIKLQESKIIAQKYTLVVSIFDKVKKNDVNLEYWKVSEKQC